MTNITTGSSKPTKIHLDAVAQRLIGDDRLGFPLARRVAVLPTLVNLAELEGATDDDLSKFGLEANTAESLLVHLHCAIDAIEAEKRSPRPQLRLMPAPKAGRKKGKAGR